ncbi:MULTISPECIES: hypothetical protein [Halomonadaceae]|uniref:Prokaryotic membrane lipoprotein lipid attachment site profile n=1 Tax=Vreelandella halophila TaxID=86177 RepID=A0A9X4Y8W4_9GAMM|nr:MULTISPECIES: hypothetical protein [Halomonas]MYL25597.1 hypothetical protein [Halomonas utahensis]MYL74833.1 hypothetical protein [Halomonas sp. 22501_18_FS]
MLRAPTAFLRLTATPLKHITLAASLLLAGCIGGGSSSGDASDTGSTAACGKTETRNLLVNENTTYRDNLSLCFSAEEASLEADGQLSELHWEGNTLAFRSSHVDRPRRTQVRILDPHGSTQLRINVVVENRSGRADEIRADHLVDESASILALSEDRQAYAYMLEVAYLEGQIDWSERQSMLADWTPETASAHGTLAEKIKKVERVLEDYRNGRAGEYELSQAADLAASYLGAHGQYAADKLMALARDQRIDVAVPDISTGELAYRAGVEQVSRHVGNPMYGELVQQQWQFDRRYRFLNDVDIVETRS